MSSWTVSSVRAFASTPLTVGTVSVVGRGGEWYNHIPSLHGSLTEGDWSIPTGRQKLFPPWGGRRIVQCTLIYVHVRQMKALWSSAGMHYDTWLWIAFVMCWNPGVSDNHRTLTERSITGKLFLSIYMRKKINNNWLQDALVRKPLGAIAILVRVQSTVCRTEQAASEP